MLTVRCPKCRHDMLYQPAAQLKRKRCVYCGTTFSVHPNLPNSRVVCEGKRLAPNAPLF